MNKTSTILPDDTDTLAALELVLEEVKRARERFKQRAKEELDADRPEMTVVLSSLIKATDEFRDKVTALQKEWTEVSRGRAPRRKLGKRSSKRDRVPTGENTPPQEFRVPILRTVEDFGGKARTRDVLERVYTIMASRLRPCDLDLVANVPRWRNTANGAYRTMVKEGLLVDHSEHGPNPNPGIWEITEKGTEWLTADGK